MRIAVHLFITFFGFAATMHAEVNHWSRQGLYGGSISCITISKTRQGLILVGSTFDRISRSIDGGTTWKSSGSDLEADGLAVHVNSLLLSEHIDDLAFAGTRRHIFRSIDGGLHWEVTPEGLPTEVYVTCLSEMKTGVHYFFAGTNCSGIYRSSDGGSSWRSVNNGLSNLEVNAITTAPKTGVVYSSTNGGVFRSDDGGNSWFSIFSSPYPCRGLHADANGTLYIGCENGVMRSVDGGENWENLYPFCVQPSSIITNPLNPSLIFVGDNKGCGLLRSTDSGLNWTNIESRLLDSSISCLSITSDGLKVFVGTSSGLACGEEEGNIWSFTSYGINGLSVNAFAFASDRDSLFAGTNCGVFRRNRLGLSWEVSVLGMIVNALVCDGKTPSNLYVGTERSGVMRSTDSGLGWEQCSPSYLPQRCTSLLVGQGPLHTLYAALFGYGVIMSEDGGDSWQTINNGLSDQRIFTLVSDPNNLQTIYAGCWDGLYKYSSETNQWLIIYPAANSLVKSVFVDPNNSATLLIGILSGIMKSTDGGLTWTSSNLGISNPVNLRLYFSLNTQDLFASNYLGVFRSLDVGDNWTLYGADFHATNSLIDDPVNDSTLIAGGIGAWSLTRSLDLNADGLVNVQDTQLLASYLGEIITLLPAGQWSGDVNLDGLVNIQDLLYSMQIIDP